MSMLTCVVKLLNVRNKRLNIFQNAPSVVMLTYYVHDVLEGVGNLPDRGHPVAAAQLALLQRFEVPIHLVQGPLRSPNVDASIVEILLPQLKLEKEASNFPFPLKK